MSKRNVTCPLQQNEKRLCIKTSSPLLGLRARKVDFCMPMAFDAMSLRPAVTDEKCPPFPLLTDVSRVMLKFNPARLDEIDEDGTLALCFAKAHARIGTMLEDNLIRRGTQHNTHSTGGVEAAVQTIAGRTFFPHAGDNTNYVFMTGFVSTQTARGYVTSEYDQVSSALPLKSIVHALGIIGSAQPLVVVAMIAVHVHVIAPDTKTQIRFSCDLRFGTLLSHLSCFLSYVVGLDRVYLDGLPHNAMHISISKDDKEYTPVYYGDPRIKRPGVFVLVRMMEAHTRMCTIRAAEMPLTFIAPVGAGSFTVDGLLRDAPVTCGVFRVIRPGGGLSDADCGFQATVVDAIEREINAHGQVRVNMHGLLLPEVPALMKPFEPLHDSATTTRGSVGCPVRQATDRENQARDIDRDVSITAGDHPPTSAMVQVAGADGTVVCSSAPPVMVSDLLACVNRSIGALPQHYKLYHRDHPRPLPHAMIIQSPVLLVGIAEDTSIVFPCILLSESKVGHCSLDLRPIAGTWKCPYNTYVEDGLRVVRRRQSQDADIHALHAGLDGTSFIYSPCTVGNSSADMHFTITAQPGARGNVLTTFGFTETQPHRTMGVMFNHGRKSYMFDEGGTQYHSGLWCEETTAIGDDQRPTMQRGVVSSHTVHSIVYDATNRLVRYFADGQEAADPIHVTTADDELRRGCLRASIWCRRNVTIRQVPPVPLSFTSYACTDTRRAPHFTCPGSPAPPQ